MIIKKTDFFFHYFNKLRVLLIDDVSSFNLDLKGHKYSGYFLIGLDRAKFSGYTDSEFTCVYDDPNLVMADDLKADLHNVMINQIYDVLLDNEIEIIDKRKRNGIIKGHVRFRNKYIHSISQKRAFSIKDGWVYLDDRVKDLNFFLSYERDQYICNEIESDIEDYIGKMFGLQEYDADENIYEI